VFDYSVLPVLQTNAWLTNLFLGCELLWVGTLGTWRTGFVLFYILPAIVGTTTGAGVTQLMGSI